MKDQEREHIERTKLFIGCLPCLIGGWPNAHADYHHAEAGRKRQAHVHGFGMCLWHHRGERAENASGSDMDELEIFFGPSFQRNKRRFLDVYGPEKLLVELNNFAIKRWNRLQWLDHEMPESVAYEIRQQHKRLLNAN